MNKRFLIIAIVLLTAGVLLMLFFNGKKDKTAYVEINKVFADFKLKKELEGQLAKIKNSRQSIVDSLELGLKVLSKQIIAEGEKDKNRIALFQVRKEQYLQKKQEFEEDNDAVAKQYDAQIISQMNQYVKDFGIKNNYTYIFGADGSGFLMYSADSKNITTEVVNYINERYKGNVE